MKWPGQSCLKFDNSSEIINMIIKWILFYLFLLTVKKVLQNKICKQNIKMRERKKIGLLFCTCTIIIYHDQIWFKISWGWKTKVLKTKSVKTVFVLFRIRPNLVYERFTLRDSIFTFFKIFGSKFNFFFFILFFVCERKKYLHNSNLMYMTMTERKVNSVNSRKTCLWISDLRYHKMIKKQERCTSSTRARRINRSPIVLQSQQLSLETRH